MIVVEAGVSPASLLFCPTQPGYLLNSAGEDTRLYTIRVIAPSLSRLKLSAF
jgi:hypothetical protein